MIIIWPKGKKTTPVAAPSAPPVQTPQTPAYRYVVSDGLNVRRGPSINYGVITVIYKNTRVQLVEGSGNVSGSWQMIRYGTIEGWVDSSYLRNTAAGGK